jgi:protein-L-isoaspartate(D-aspartate) O-methyltransferase
MTDPDWIAQRDHMIQTQIRARGVTDPRVLDALARVPRERFVHPDARTRAYSDHALGIGHHQTISQPYMVAIMTATLAPGPDERVLEIGTGSGYQSAILACLAKEVWTVERIRELADSALERLRELGFSNVHVRTGDGSVGWPEAAPFDAILVTAGAPAPPPSLLTQLDPGRGRMVIPVGGRDLQHLVRVERRGTEFVSDRTVGCRFVPLVGDEGWGE